MNPGLLLSDDFLFISRIQGHARATGLEVKSVRTASALLEQTRAVKPTCVLMDLNLGGLDIGSVVTGLKALEPAPTIVGYGSHVDAATLKRAREAGCDWVFPRSKFVEELPTALAAWFGAAKPLSGVDPAGEETIERV